MKAVKKKNDIHIRLISRRDPLSRLGFHLLVASVQSTFIHKPLSFTIPKSSPIHYVTDYITLL